MKRWSSVGFALGTFLGVIVVSMVALLHMQFGSLNAAASPVTKPTQTLQKTSNSNGSFADAERFFTANNITLSIRPKSSLSLASWTPYESTEATNVRVAASELQDEMSKYSHQTLQASGLKSIYLVSDLFVNGQARSGMPEPLVEHALYFDASDKYLQSENGQYMRRTFHHEFSHLIAYDLYGKYTPNDAAWERCNTKEASYGNGGASMYADPEYAHKLHPSYGFIDGYATSAPEEDTAEMFTYYMTDLDYLSTVASKDAGIACKLSLTEKLLRTLQ